MERPTAVRGRPRNAARRARIVRAALELFAEYGYHGCTMREVAAACELGETLLYRYYARKTELFDAVVEHAAERLTTVRESMSATASRATELWDMLLTCGTVYLYHVEGFSAWYALWAQRLPIPADVHDRLCGIEQAITDDLADALRRFADWHDAYAAASAFTGSVRAHVMMQDRIVRRTESAAARSLFLEELTEIVIAAARLPDTRPAPRSGPRRPAIARATIT
jgi:AcrR family transcriptional regulator